MSTDPTPRRYSRFLGPDARRDVDDELAFHFAMRVDEFEQAGMSHAEAVAAARERFGNIDQVRDECVELGQRRLTAHHRRFQMDALRQDARFAVRTIFANRGFSMAVALTMALGIAANTVVFSVAYGVLVRPLPYRDAGSLVRLWSMNVERNVEFFSVSPADFADWRAQNRVFSAMAAFDRQRTATLTRGGEAQSVEVAPVTPDVFILLGTAAHRGRVLVQDDVRNGPPVVAVLGHALWTTRFGADSAVIGKDIMLDGRNVMVVGVMPPRFYVPGTPAEIWTPLQLAGHPADRSFRFLRVLARLRPGVDLEAAKSGMDAIARAIARESPTTNKGWAVNIMSIPETIVGREFKRGVLVLLGVVVAVLLIACANSANLQLARAAARRREIAVRAALGATRSRIVLQLLAESTMLALAGGVLGLGLAYLGLGVLRSVGAETVPRLEDIRLDAPVLAFCALVTLGSGVLFGLLPALRASRADLGDVLKTGGRDGHAVIGRSVRAALVVCQVSLSLVLLIGAGLLLRSFARLAAVDVGFRPVGVTIMPLAVPEATYPDNDRAWAFYASLLDRVKALPGIEQVAAVNSAPFLGPNTGTVFLPEGRQVPVGERPSDADLRLITPGYFRTLGIALTHGRDLSELDQKGGPEVMLINETMAKQSWPGQDPVGRRVRIGDVVNGSLVTIVGVVADVRYQSLDSPAIRPMMYLSARANPRRAMVIVMRGADPVALSPSVREAVASLDPALPPPTLRSMVELLDLMTSTSRFTAVLLALFASAALVLAAIGIYGVMSYLVRQRTHELGIRVALGAPSGSLLASVVGGALRLTLVGIAIGLVAAWGVTRWLGALLFETSPTDPVTFAAIGLLLATVAVCASLVPARRAAKADPLVALRDS